jgi:ubiquinone/menaquinone biosynthesis C-methylase UbiE
LTCAACSRQYPVVLGIPDLRLFPDPYIGLEPDREKGIKVGAKLESLSFEQLIDYYYSTTSVVPPHHARQYKAGLLAGPARSKAALKSWDELAGRGPCRLMLEVGCGTAPLLVAAAARFPRMAGVDISFRWLVVAKKRLAETRLDLPLLCACAEALPFPDGAFDRVAIEFAVENFEDQPRAARECGRVLSPGGCLCISMPNRFSPGPDPHVGLWCGSLLPDRWIAAYARRSRAVPPRRRLLSPASLDRLLREAGFEAPRVAVPALAAEQLARFGPAVRALAGTYRAALHVPVCGQALRWIAPILHAVARKPERRATAEPTAALCA